MKFSKTSVFVLLFFLFGAAFSDNRYPALINNTGKIIDKLHIHNWRNDDGASINSLGSSISWDSNYYFDYDGSSWRKSNPYEITTDISGYLKGYGYPWWRKMDNRCIN